MTGFVRLSSNRLISSVQSPHTDSQQICWSQCPVATQKQTKSRQGFASVAPVVFCESRIGSSHSGAQLLRPQAPGYGSGQSSHSPVPCPVPVPTLSLTDARRRRVSNGRQSACKRDAAAVRRTHRKQHTTHAHAAQPFLISKESDASILHRRHITEQTLHSC